MMSARDRASAQRWQAAIRAATPQLLRDCLPSGKIEGDIYIALNPLREDRNLGSFRIDMRTGKWNDFALGIGGSDTASLYAYLRHEGNYQAAFQALKDHPVVTAFAATGIAGASAKVATPLTERADKIAKARKEYDHAEAIWGMPAETYLRGRALKPNCAWDGLRASISYHPEAGHCPTLIAPFAALDGSLTGIHRTYLTPAGKKLAGQAPRRSLGAVKGGAIRLGEATSELIICEGLEDGLTLFQELSCSTAVWVAGGTHFMPLMAIPPEITSIAIATDNDPAGESAAAKAADLLCSPTRDVRIMRPERKFKDFNDQLREISRG